MSELRIRRMPEKEELTILVLDGSGSMAIEDVREEGRSTPLQRAAAVENAVNEFVKEHLGRSRLKHERWLAVITYDHRAECYIDPICIQEWEKKDDTGRPLPMSLPKELNLLSRHGGSTAIGTALRLAQSTAELWLSGQTRADVPRYVNICLLTDGKEEEGTDPERAAEDIKKTHSNPKGRLQRPEVVIATAAFGTDPDVLQYREVLKRMSTPVRNAQGQDEYPFFEIAPNGAKLKAWLIASSEARPVEGPRDA